MSIQHVNLTASAVYIYGGRLSLSSTEDKIDSFAYLRRGWDHGQGGPIAEKTRKIAKAWNEFLQFHEFWETDAFANGGGEILIAVRCGDHYFELIVEADHTISVAYDFKRRQVFFRSHMNVLRAQQTVLEIKGRIWSTFAYSTQTNTMWNRDNLLGSLLRIPAVDYQSLLGTAFRLPASPFAPIFENILSGTATLWEILPYSGVSISQPPSPQRHIR